MKPLFFIPLFAILASCGSSSDSKLSDSTKSTGKTKPVEQLQVSKNSAFQTLKTIGEYQLAWSKARTNIILWVNTPNQRQEKLMVKNFLAKEIPNMKSTLNEMVNAGIFNTADSIPTLCNYMDVLGSDYTDIMEELSTVESYQDPMAMFPATTLSMGKDQQCEIYYYLVDSRLAAMKEKISTVVEKELQLVSH